MELWFDVKKSAFLVVLAMVLRLILPVNYALWVLFCIFCYLGYVKFSKVNAVFLAALMMNLWYVFLSWGNVRQYDYYNFVKFADYYISHNFFIDNPSEFFSEIYYHPPMWGILTAFVTKLGLLGGLEQEMAFDCVRFVNLFAITAGGIIFWRLMKLFNFNERLRLGLFALYVFFPAHSLASNLVNNDVMVYFFMLLSVYLGYLWYESGQWRECVFLSAVLFFAGMIKFSGLMVVSYVGILGIARLICVNNKFEKKLWGQFGLIGVATVLGFTWGIFLLYNGLPLVSPPVNVYLQNLRSYGILERLFGMKTFLYPYSDVWGLNFEVNVFLALVKTALFGEWVWDNGIWGYIIYGFGLVLSLVLFLSFFSLFKYNMGKDFTFNTAVIVFVVAVLISWMLFWNKYPYFCSTEFRYVTILFPISLLWLGNYLNHKHLPNVLNYTLAGLIIFFIIAKFMLYLNTI